jgi:hypothetical protein
VAGQLVIDMDKLQSLAGVFDFFIPTEVLSSVMLVFAMENIFEFIFKAYIPNGMEAGGWIAVYIAGTIVVFLLNYISADVADKEDLSDDLEDISKN